jgi:uncharacterized protein (TIGR02118 family)
MIKLIAFLKRKPGMTMEEFKQRWVVEHTKISSQLPGLLGYRINIAIEEQETDEPLYDGTAELWWNSLEEMKASFSTEIGVLAGEDGDVFTSLRVHLYTEEFDIVPGPDRKA